MSEAITEHEAVEEPVVESTAEAVSDEQLIAMLVDRARTDGLQLTVIGNLVEDPELRFTAAGVAVARFTVASTPRTFDRDANTWRDGEPTFMDCSCWRQLAENVAGSLSKGARVVVAGRLRTDRWENPEGEKRSRMVLDVDDVGASMTFATVAITRTSRPVPPRETAPDDPWASASPIRPAAPAAGPDDTPGEEPPF
ncbi:single-stranded DNA-binding protein [Streptomyces sp. NPDC051133]|uniref:single-stranded DNA-binding protein n=1 Tax=Streptomyces sp. NPDC051133 TaxID=3155521 RepID=UPI003412F55A